MAMSMFKMVIWVKNVEPRKYTRTSTFSKMTAFRMSVSKWSELVVKTAVSKSPSKILY